MKFDIKHGDVVVEDRACLLRLSWGCIKAWFKRMPVLVYSGPVELDLTDTEELDRFKELLNALSN